METVRTRTRSGVVWIQSVHVALLASSLLWSESVVRPSDGRNKSANANEFASAIRHSVLRAILHYEVVPVRMPYRYSNANH
jgi:hypothetical protein